MSDYWPILTATEISASTMVITVPSTERATVFATSVGNSVVRVGEDAVSLLPGETAIVENGRIVAPKRILDERRSDLKRRLFARLPRAGQP